MQLEKTIFLFLSLNKKSVLSTVPGRLVWQRIKCAASRPNFARFNWQMEIVCFHNATSILQLCSEAAVPPKAIRRNKMTLYVCTSIYDHGSFLPSVNLSCVAAPGPFSPPSWWEIGRGFAWIFNIPVDFDIESKLQVLERGVWDICHVPEGWRD